MSAVPASQIKIIANGVPLKETDLIQKFALQDMPSEIRILNEPPFNFEDYKERFSQAFSAKEYDKAQSIAQSVIEFLGAPANNKESAKEWLNLLPH
jgi:hypothetical protein